MGGAPPLAAAEGPLRAVEVTVDIVDGTAFTEVRRTLLNTRGNGTWFEVVQYYPSRALPTRLAVRWRGKPPGLGLVAQLLQDGRISPDVETDCEYLEAELSDIERGDANWRPAPAMWTVDTTIRISRMGEHGAFLYTRSEAPGG